ncbi:PTS sugar transporter subunit IIA [Streptococcus jiangjianxini]|uniref:PTS sugar transporter subunit IIA n=1 Tax=Streptococcus jiangjianxini TaxID=3161189 RepID=UPI0032EAE15D
MTVLEKAPVITGEEVLSPLTEQVFPLSEADDEVFVSGAVGDGVVIIPEDNIIYASFDRVVSSIFPSKHAIGLISDKGAEVLIHIGINTVDLAGRGFEAFVKDGDRIVFGQPLIQFDVSVIEEAGLSTQTMIIVTNKADYSDVTFSEETYRKVKSSLMTLKK